MTKLRTKTPYALALAAVSLPTTCAQAETPDTPMQAPPVSPAQGCAPVPGWDAVAAQRPYVVVLGELHGTEQSPAFLSRLACALAHSGQHVLVGVELSAEFNAKLQEAWAGPPETFPERLARTDFKGRRDGVASRAMFEMLVELHTLKSAGASIDIVAFNGTISDEQRAEFSGMAGQNRHEAAQAMHICDALALNQPDIALILLGGLHARLEAKDINSISVEPMAMRLARDTRLISLRMYTTGGTAWNCIPKPGFVPEPGQAVGMDKIECASHPQIKRPPVENTPFITLYPAQGNTSVYDGYFQLGEVSASPPALESQTQPPE